MLHVLKNIPSRNTPVLFPQATVLIALLTLLLQSCTTIGGLQGNSLNLPPHNLNVPPSQPFQADENFNVQHNTALLVLGITADQDLANHEVSLTWQQYNPRDNTVVEEGATITANLEASQQNRNNVSQASYHAFRVRPGHYILHKGLSSYEAAGHDILNSPLIWHPSSIIKVADRRYGVQHYQYVFVPFSRGRQELNAQNILDDILDTTISHRFYAKPGDIIYIGNFNVGRNTPYVHLISADFLKAATFLSENYPNVKGSLVFRPPLNVVNVVCNFKEQREQGISALQDMIVTNSFDAQNLQENGCVSGVKMIAAEKPEKTEKTN